MGDYLFASHIGDKGFGDFHGAVGLLIVFKDGGHASTHGKAGAIECVYQLGFFCPGASKFNASPAGLEVHAIAARRDFPVGVLAGHPHLKVIGF